MSNVTLDQLPSGTVVHADPPTQEKYWTPPQEANARHLAVPKLPIRLNNRWRVNITNNSYVLERNGVTRPDSWDGHSWPQKRSNLLRSIEERCGKVDADALRQVGYLPQRIWELTGEGW